MPRGSGGGAFLRLTGGSLTGELDMNQNAIILQSNDGNDWKLTINTSGQLVVTDPDATTPSGGSPVGMLLAITTSS